MAKLFFIGDSITAGAWDDRGGWAGRLIGQILHKSKTSEKKHLGFYCMPYNLGISGDTIADVIRRFEKEVLARTYGDSPKDTVQLVCAVGVNDSVYLMNEDRQHAPDDVFEEDLKNLICMTKKITSNITFIGLLPVIEEKTSPCPWLPSVGYQNKEIKRCNGLLRKNCEIEGVTFFDVYDKWSAMPNLDEYLSDGLHPNAKGHELIAQQIGAFLLTPEFDKFHTKR